MYQDADLEFWGEVFIVCDLASTGLRFDQFITDPIGALTNMPQTRASAVWARHHSLTATQVTEIIPVRLGAGWTDNQQAGIAAHDRHDKLARRFQTTPTPTCEGRD